MVALEDSFISDEEVEYCPLCVEEMDISDKNFRPCPCGYQICQFCYNNIRQNPELNGRCPGCRRLYDDESVEYKTLTAEEYKMQQFKKEKREREKKQKEKEKKESEIASKKHLAGLRVVQKNLVYVTGLSPPCAPEDLHSVLRSDKYFGQYGKITKIVINRKTPGGSSGTGSSSSQSIVVYVTFARKEDASRCIAELDGSLCDGKVLRAAHGTTKYCSSYLRGHPCANPNCMFLHEPGEEADSYTRKDLSTQQGIKMGMSGARGGHHHGEDDSQSETDDHHHTSNSQHQAFQSNNTPNIAHAVTSSGILPSSGLSSSGTNVTLPATANWAKGVATEASPQVSNNAPMANTEAFPSLGEIFKEQKQKKDVKQKSKSKSNKDGQLLPDDIDIDDNTGVSFVEDTAERLRQLAESRQLLKVHFEDMVEKPQLLPLFHFNDSCAANSTTPEEEKLLCRSIIEQFLLRPIKKYHLAYSNHPISQQQQFLHQQAQLQQQAQAVQQTQTPNLNPSHLNQIDPHAQQQPQASQMAQPHLQGQQSVSDSVIQQQQQLLLLQQLQQQAMQQGKQQQTPSQLSAQLNQLRMSERSKTATPPPPGLFGKATTENAQQPPLASQSSSSQLLTQLMSGKK